MTQGPDGKFRSADEHAAEFEDLEYVSFYKYYTNTNGDDTANQPLFAQEGTWDGDRLIDFEDIVDRHEVARLVHADVAAAAYGFGADATPGGLARWLIEISASPTSQVIEELTSVSINNVEGDTGGDATIQASEDFLDDTADLPVPPLSVMSSQAGVDDTNGNANGADFMRVQQTGPTPGTWDFDRRDELFVNGLVEMNGVSNAVSLDLTGQMVFGIEGD